MPPTNLIINGTFDNGSANWTGTDLEFNPETAFLGNGSQNTVSELDGRTGFTTVLEQTFTVDNPEEGVLTFDTALRTASSPNVGEGFVVEVLDSNGVAIASMTVLPTQNSFTTISMDVDFPSAGDYTLRFTELGIDDSLGAIVDNISLIVCFASGTRIATELGEVPVEKLKVGDRIVTRSGIRTLRWIGRRTLAEQDLKAEPRLRPVRISQNALGEGVPDRDLRVSRQHRMQTGSAVAQRMFGTPDVLVSAIRLTELPGIDIDEDGDGVTYFHLLFDEHEIVFANGAPSESLLLSQTSLAAISAEAREEIQLIFPGLTAADLAGSRQKIPERKLQRRLIERLSKNRKPVIEAHSA